MSYNYELAKSTLSEVEKNRLLCVFLHCDQQTIDWQAATVAFGAASVESMRVMARNTLKKVKNPDDGIGKVASPGVGADSGIDNTPKKNPAAKKRKAAGREDDDGVENPKTPRGRKPKGAAMACTEDDGSTEEPGIKAEDTGMD